MSHGSKFLPCVRDLPIKRIGGLKPVYFPGAALYHREQEDYLGVVATKRILAEAAYEKRRREPDKLHWRVTTATSHKAMPLAVQRNKVGKQWRAAFVTSLKKHGLDRLGRPREGGIRASKGVRGTLNLLIFHGFGWELNDEQRLAATNQVVRKLLDMDRNRY